MIDAERMLGRVGLSFDHLQVLTDLLEEGSGYVRYSVPKRDGGTRIISAPTSECGTVLKGLRLAIEWTGVYSPPVSVHGFVAGRGIVSNASQHLGQAVVLNADLADFFPSIESGAIVEGLVGHGLSEEHAIKIVGATTINGSLPAGFSTSPLLSNIVFRDTDLDLEEFAAKHGVTYTRYADDLTFSGTFTDDLLHGLVHVLAARGWILNDSKTRFMRRGRAQYVTGLYVGDPARPHVPRRMKRRLRQRLHYLSEHGFADVAGRNRNEAMTWDAASGWVSYLRQVEPEAAAPLAAVLGTVDFGNPPLRWGNPDDWTAILDEIGM